VLGSEPAESTALITSASDTMEKRILRLHKGGTGTVQRVVMEQPRPF
jgi:hypothetical protein